MGTARVVVGVIDLETNENCVWFMVRLKEAIDNPVGLTSNMDCGQTMMNEISEVFPHVEYRECVPPRQNFKKRYRGKVFNDHLWATAYSWSPYMFEKLYLAMAEAKPRTMKYLRETHKKLWTCSHSQRWIILPITWLRVSTAICALASAICTLHVVPSRFEMLIHNFIDIGENIQNV